MTDLFAQPILLGASLAGFAVLMSFVTYFTLRRMQRLGLRTVKREFDAQQKQLHASLHDAQTRMMSARVAETKLIEKIQLDIAQVQSDLEWLTGERMVDQAVALAKAGVQSDDILRETGYTKEDVDIMSRFRRH